MLKSSKTSFFITVPKLQKKRLVNRGLTSGPVCKFEIEDYSEVKWNIDGYTNLTYSVIWGVLEVVTIKYFNPGLAALLKLISSRATVVIIIIAVGFIVLDSINTKKRLGNANSARVSETEKAEKVRVFAYGCDFYKLFWLFVIGSFLGAFVEIIFCRITGGVWMSRSSLVWGQFSVVWGLGVTFFTALVYNYRNSLDIVLFLIGFFLGGTFEYFCSVFTELIFGAVFWDYSQMPFNLGGRINILYCFSWGVASVVWFKVVYPVLSGWIEKIPLKAGIYLTVLLMTFMTANMTVSVLALVRYDQRTDGVKAGNMIEKSLDDMFPNIRMESIYPNAIKK